VFEGVAVEDLLGFFKEEVIVTLLVLLVWSWAGFVPEMHVTPLENVELIGKLDGDGSTEVHTGELKNCGAPVSPDSRLDKPLKTAGRDWF
jgi:hypothetical protein